MGNATNDFSFIEFRCRCGECEYDGRHMNMDFLNKLQIVRAWYALPMFPSSGSRCPKWNTVVGGVTNSQHLLTQGCRAADFPIKTGQQRATLAKLALNAGLSVGLSDNFIHLDDRGMPQIIFLY